MHNKPLSPHLSIYKPQITSVLSILHRLTGLALFFSFIGLLWVLNYMTIRLQTPGDLIANFTDFFGNKIIMVLLIIISYCFMYHFFSGIRYLLWDQGRLMSLKSVKILGWLAILLSSLSTALFWYYIYNLS